MKTNILCLFLLLFLGFSIRAFAQSEELDDATKLNFFIEGPLIEKGHSIIIFGNDQGKMSKSVMPGIQKNVEESMLKYCDEFGYRNCRVDKVYESDESPTKEIIKNIGSTKHYIVEKGENKTYRITELISDSKGPDM